MINVVNNFKEWVGGKVMGIVCRGLLKKSENKDRRTNKDVNTPKYDVKTRIPIALSQP